jgi:hypothetical protein
MPTRHDLARPTVVLPLLLAAALLAFAFKLGGLAGIRARIAALPVSVLWLAVALAAVYLTLKALQLRLLLANLGLRMRWPEFALAFCVGELTLTLPFGLFSQNWVMSAASRIDVARSAGATLMMLLGETIVALLVLAAVGIPGWSPLRPAAGAVALACVIVVPGLLRYEHVTTRLADRVRPGALRNAARSGVALLGSLRRLSRPRLLAINVLLAASYLAALAWAFLAVGHGMGVHALDYTTAMTVYAFALVVVLFGGGAFGQVGTVDVLGMMAARSWGIGYADGLAMMIGFRVVWTASMWLLNLPVVVWLRFPIARGRARDDARSAEKREKALD